jgi:hypothetical protein
MRQLCIQGFACDFDFGPSYRKWAGHLCHAISHRKTRGNIEPQKRLCFAVVVD